MGATIGLVTILAGVYTLSSRDFQDLEVQFVSEHLLHNSTLELPDIPDDESVSSPQHSRRLSIRLSIAGDERRALETGGIFTELATIPASPLARELIHGAKWFAPRKRNETLSVDRAVENSLEREHSLRKWKIFPEQNNEFPDLSRSEDINSDDQLIPPQWKRSPEPQVTYPKVQKVHHEKLEKKCI